MQTNALVGKSLFDFLNDKDDAAVLGCIKQIMDGNEAGETKVYAPVRTTR